MQIPSPADSHGDWREARRILACEIAAGLPEPGEKLPTQAGLMARFGLGRHEVRRTLEALRGDGLIESRQGAIAQVALRQLPLPVSARTRFSETARGLRLDGASELLWQRRRVPTQAVARLLAMPKVAPVETALILRRLAGRPASLSFHYFAPAAVRNLPDLPPQNPRITDALRDCGITDYLRWETTVAARLPMAQEAFHLDIARSEPVLAVTGVNVLQGGAPVEVSISVFPAARIRLQFRFDLTPPA